MIEIIALGFLAVSSIFYVYFITRVRLGLLVLQPSQRKTSSISVSIILAARNEENNIEQCLQSLLKQTYPSHLFEIIVIDDGSEDKTASIVQYYAERFSNVHLQSLPTDSTILRGKPKAIAVGITKAIGEIILTTDADCIVPPQWIEVMVNHFENDVMLVAGPVAERDSNTFFSKLDQLEFLGLITTAAGLIGGGRPIICNGANLAYRKTAFFAVGGFGDVHTSNDDESLMNKIVNRKIGRIVFAPESGALVTTNSSNTLLSFLRQRIRWVNKRGHYEDMSIFITLIFLYVFFASMFFTTLLVIREPQLLLPLIIAFCGKIFVDYFTLRSGARLFQQDIPTLHFLIAELLHVPYIVIVSPIGQFASMKWKERIIKR